MLRLMKPFLAFLAFTFSLFIPPLNAAATVDLTILHMNDTHGHVLPYIEKSVSESVPVSGAAYFARLIEEERSQNPDGTLLLSAGDMFQGTPISNLFRGRPVIDVMNTLRFDAMAVGNHEFDWGRDVLSTMMASASFPFISANINDQSGKLLPGAKPYILMERKDLKIAVIGVTTPETKVTTKPGHVSDLQFQEPAEVVPGVIQEVKQKGAQLVIVLSHLGLDADIELAGRVSGIDVIVGGHSHTAVTTPVKVGETVIVQAGYYGIYLGVLKLKVDLQSSSVIESTENNALKTVFAGPGDTYDDRVAQMVAVYNDQVKSEFARVVGEAQVDLMRDPLKESNLGNAISDAMKEASGAAIAFQNGGGIRADLLKGPITMEGVYTALPFDNVLMAMDLTGQQILELLEKNATLEFRILQVSGMRVTYDMGRPAGSRVISAVVEVGSSSGRADEPLQPEKTYRVVTNDFLAAGGDNFTPFRDGKNVVYGDTLRDVFVAFLQKHTPISPRIENRQRMLNP